MKIPIIKPYELYYKVCAIYSCTVVRTKLNNLTGYIGRESLPIAHARCPGGAAQEVLSEGLSCITNFECSNKCMDYGFHILKQIHAYMQYLASILTCAKDFVLI